MYFLFFFACHVLSTSSPDIFKTDEQINSVEDKFLDINFDNIAKTTNLKRYNKLVTDYFLSICKHPEIKKMIKKISSENLFINRNVLLVDFKHFLLEYFLNKKYNTKYLYDSTFIDSLAFHSYKLILKLINKKFKKRIIESIDLKMDENDNNKILKLFKEEKYDKIFNVRKRRYVPIYTHKKTSSEHVLDDVKIEYIGKPVYGAERARVDEIIYDYSELTK
ncbi:uncharacterized protein VNE69_10073 [Vairimorpha necatrix]|uniref:Uncharacterized protein n=1 Tax=Vairimorpha necatrix TaxID=6039 RepID=A0AAX4JFJ8_9MICR